MCITVIGWVLIGFGWATGADWLLLGGRVVIFFFFFLYKGKDFFKLF